MHRLPSIFATLQPLSPSPPTNLLLFLLRWAMLRLTGQTNVPYANVIDKTNRILSFLTLVTVLCAPRKQRLFILLEHISSISSDFFSIYKMFSISTMHYVSLLTCEYSESINVFSSFSWWQLLKNRTLCVPSRKKPHLLNSASYKILSRNSETLLIISVVLSSCAFVLCWTLIVLTSNRTTEENLCDLIKSAETQSEQMSKDWVKREIDRENNDRLSITNNQMQ